jgi:hypothetical protein
MIALGVRLREGMVGRRGTSGYKSVEPSNGNTAPFSEYLVLLLMYLNIDFSVGWPS